MKPPVINSCHRIKNSDSECPEGTNCEYPPVKPGNLGIFMTKVKGNRL